MYKRRDKYHVIITDEEGIILEDFWSKSRNAKKFLVFHNQTGNTLGVICTVYEYNKKCSCCYYDSNIDLYFYE